MGVENKREEGGRGGLTLDRYMSKAPGLAADYDGSGAWFKFNDWGESLSSKLYSITGTDDADSPTSRSEWLKLEPRQCASPPTLSNPAMD